jgi:hypothetical protein
MHAPPRTVWSEGALALVPKRFKPIYQVFYPVVDGFFVLFSLYAALIGSRVIADSTLHWFTYVWAGVMVTAASATFLAQVYMMAIPEMVGRVLMGICLAVYVALLIGYSINVRATSGLSAIIVIIAFIVMTFKILDLINQVAQHQEAKSRAKR